MKILKMILRRLGLYSVSKLSNESHWTDNWEKAEYRIVVYSNASGTKHYTPQRKKYGEDVWALITSLGSRETQKEAMKDIEDNKDFYREQWNIQHTGKYEYINV